MGGSWSKRPGERPPCPKHGFDGRVILDGHQVRSDKLFGRPRFRCYPDDGSRDHAFLVARRQPTHDHPFGRACNECDRDYGPADGARVARRYTQSINEIAGVLAAAGRGDSLRMASTDARQSARRFTLGPFPASKETPRARRGYPSNQNVMAARYLDGYGPAVLERVLPDHWPRLLVLDSKPLNIRPYGVLGWNQWGDESLPGGGLLAAAGTDEESRNVAAWRLHFAGDETHRSWLSFFEQLDGDPEWIVADRAEAIWKAVELRWPKAIRFNCAYHLGENLKAAAIRDGVLHAGTNFEETIRAAFHSVAEWEALADLAERHRAENVLVWMVQEEPLVRHQIELRAQFPDRPRSNRGAEALVATADGRIGKRRRNFRNAARFQILLGLITADRRGAADPTAYARTIRDQIERGAMPRLGAGMDPDAVVNDAGATGVGSVASLLLRTAGITAQHQRSYWIDAKTRSIMRIADEFNRERAKAGIPPIEVLLSPRGVAYVSTKGKMLADFPEFAREWDTAKNGRGPEGVPAGDTKGERHWRCDRGHPWKARTGDRIKRLRRCQRCSTQRADPTTSLAAVHPELLASWDSQANRPLEPHAIKATYARTVSWLCLAGRNHPSYTASIAKRLKDEDRALPAVPEDASGEI